MTKDLKGSLAWAAGLIILGLCASYARKQGYIDPDTTTRTVMGAIGLMVAWFGDRAPKGFLPSVRARQATRVAGWSLAISGLIYAGLWAFAPIPVAIWSGCGAVLIGMAATFGYCLVLQRKPEVG